MKIDNENKNLIRKIIGRRGIYPTRWYSNNDNQFAHSLLPTSGQKAVYQPYVLANNSILLFSGEIWSFDRSKSDTIELSKLILSEEINTIYKKIDGNYAIVLYDQVNDRITFFTDKLGEQPLHYYQDDDGLIISSEIKCLTILDIPFNKVKHVIPGNIYNYKSKKLSLHPIIKFHSSNKKKDYDIDELRKIISNSVKTQCKSCQQEVAILLSGGIDSTIIAYEALNYGIKKAFTVAISEESVDAKNASKIAKYLGLDWELVVAEPESPEYAIFLSEVSNRSIIEEITMHIALAKHIQMKNIRILLTGIGADELFIGYYHLFGRIHASELQNHLLTTHYKLDLRAMNKTYLSYGIEIRNPFLAQEILDFVCQIDYSELIGPKKILKYPLRQTYKEILQNYHKEKILIARESMGVKKHFQEKLGDSPYIYRKLIKEIFKRKSIIKYITNGG